MKYAIEMGSGYIKIGSAIPKLMGGGIHRHAHTHIHRDRMMIP
jgi:hypothetical protein